VQEGWQGRRDAGVESQEIRHDQEPEKETKTPQGNLAKKEVGTKKPKRIGGRIIFWVEDKMAGTILGDDGRRYACYKADCAGEDRLFVNDRVTFLPVETARKLMAKDIL